MRSIGDLPLPAISPDSDECIKRSALSTTTWAQDHFRAERRACVARAALFLSLLIILATPRSAALDPTSRISQYGHTSWRVQDGYFGSQPFAIAQTQDGYIWVGTRDGLYRFDGVQFVRWSSPSEEKLPASSVVSLLSARDGSLWIGTEAGLARLANNHLTVYSGSQGWVIVSILEDRDGRIWIDRFSRTDDRDHPLCQVLNTGIRCYGKEDGLDAFGSGPLLQDASGNLGVGSGTTLVRWREGESRVYRPKALISSAGQSGVDGLAVAPDGSLWVGMGVTGRGAGLQRMVDATLRPYVAPRLNGETLNVLDLMLDRESTLWVGTANGVYRIRGPDVDHFGAADGLSGDEVSGFLEDREGNIWVLTSQGVDMFRDLPVKSISENEGLAAGGVQSILATRDGRVLIGTSRLQVLENGGISSALGRALHGRMVTFLLEDHAGHLWVGMDNTLYVHEGGRFRPITRRDGSPVGMVAGIAEDSENNIWIETIGPPGELIRIRDRAVQQEFPSPQMPLARRVIADPQGGIWLGLVSGDLARYRAGQLSTFSFGNHTRSRIGALAIASDGSILGGADFGVVAWKNGMQQILTTRNGLPCNSINALIPDNEGDLWLYAECGLIEISKAEMSRWWGHPDARLKLRVFGTLDGVQPGFGNFSSSARTPDGRLWFANGNVAQVVDPAHITANTVPPPVYVNAVIADHKSYAVEGAVHLPALTRDLELDYTALSFAVPQRVLFRYMLKGRDNQWQEPGTRRQAFYTDLAPGHYRFHVIACNNDGVWNETGAFLDLSIAPAWYQTHWFWLLCVVTVLGLLWIAYRLRLHQLQRQFATGLEARVGERLRIARELHDTLLQSLQGAVFQFQAARRLLLRNADNAMVVVDEAIHAAEEGIAEGRAAIRDLRPEPAAERDLPELLNDAGRELATAHELDEHAPSYRVVVEGNQQDLSPMLQDEVYRISREVIRNAFAHAAASLIEVEIRYDENELRLRIRDDGKGMDPEILRAGEVSGHWGIPGMRERAQRIGARLDFWSEAGAGTEVQLAVPAAMAYEERQHGARFRFFRRTGRDDERS